jgi:hypothetical protein
MKTISEIIKELDSISEDSTLLEGQSYENMFDPLYSFLKHWADQYKNSGTNENGFNLGEYVSQWYDRKRINDIFDINETIKHAKSILKKNDRVVWFLKIFRIKVILNLYENNKNTPGANMFASALSDYARKEASFFQGDTGALIAAIHHSNANQLLNEFAHYLSLPIPEIQNTVWLKQTPKDLILGFKDVEKKWQEENRQAVAQEEHHEVILKFPDEKCWFNLNQEYCEKEGLAMGHCGNKAAYKEGDRVLSLREPAQNGRWRPLLTFILHEDGNLGEMKGRGNAKPAPQYHSYIIALLKLPIIKGISGGGYAPERNFSMKDLPENEQKELYEIKPALAPLTYQYEKNGFNAFLWQRALTKMVDQIPDLESGHNVKYDEKDKLVILETFKNLKEFLETCGTYDIRRGRKDNAISYVMDYYNGENTVDYYPEINFSEIVDFIGNLPKEYHESLEKFVTQTYKIEVENDSDIAEAIEENHDELFSLIRSSIMDGLRAGYEDEMFKDFKKRIMGWTAEGMSLKFPFSGEHPQFDDIVELVMKPTDFFETLDEGKGELLYYDGQWVSGEDAPYLDEPRYGWSGYDKEIAMERFKSELPKEIEKFLPKKKVKKIKK